MAGIAGHVRYAMLSGFLGMPGPPLPHAWLPPQWWSKWDYMRVSQQEVHAAFERFGLLDERVHFHKVRHVASVQ